MGVVECGADQIGHARIDDHEVLPPLFLQVQDASHQHPGVGDDRAPRL
jgi:hypothetical protein